MTRYLFDTNIVRGIYYGAGSVSNGIRGIDRDAAVDVKNALTKSGDSIVVAIDTVQELVAHICEAEREQYEEFRGAIDVALAFSNSQILEEPDYVLQRAVIGRATRLALAERVRAFAEVIRATREFASLYSIAPCNIFENDYGIVYPSITQCGILKKQLDLWKTRWAADLMNAAEQTFLPDYREELEAGFTPKIEAEGLREGGRNLLNKYPEFHNVFLESVAIRAGATEPVAQSMRDRLEAQLCAMYCAYRAIWEKIITGYKLPNHANDFVDFHLLVHLVDDDVVFVTNDCRLSRLIPSSCVQRSRVINFDELAARYGVL